MADWKDDCDICDDVGVDTHKAMETIKFIKTFVYKIDNKSTKYVEGREYLVDNWLAREFVFEDHAAEYVDSPERNPRKCCDCKLWIYPGNSVKMLDNGLCESCHDIRQDALAEKAAAELERLEAEAEERARRAIAAKKKQERNKQKVVTKIREARGLCVALGIDFEEALKCLE